RYVPQLRRGVGADVSQQLAVRAERHRVEDAAGAGAGGQRWADGLPGGRVPQPHPAVPVGAGQQPAVRAERHPPHAVIGAGTDGRGGPTGCPVAGSHSCTLPSESALASSLPSGLNATPVTPPLALVSAYSVPSCSCSAIRSDMDE